MGAEQFLILYRVQAMQNACLMNVQQIATLLAGRISVEDVKLYRLTSGDPVRIVLHRDHKSGKVWLTDKYGNYLEGN